MPHTLSNFFTNTRRSSSSKSKLKKILREIWVATNLKNGGLGQGNRRGEHLAKCAARV